VPSTLRGVKEPPLDPDPSDGEQAAGVRASEGEEVDALPVLAPGPSVVSADRLGGIPERRAIAIPAVQAAAVAAGGFVAGAAVVGLVHRRHRRSSALAKGRSGGRQLGRGGRSAGRAGELVQIVGSRSLLVDVHLLGGSDADRSR
jgi:hypothetical protein